MPHKTMGTKRLKDGIRLGLPHATRSRLLVVCDWSRVACHLEFFPCLLLWRWASWLDLLGWGGLAAPAYAGLANGETGGTYTMEPGSKVTD